MHNIGLDQKDDPLLSALKSQNKVWAIGGGKGGVGKSLVTANVSICLALMGYKVVAVDLDLGGANLHTCLGLPIPELTLSDYVSKKVIHFADLLVKTPIQNLQIISGAQDEIGIANLKYMHKNKILNNMHKLEADFIIFDLGAGTSFNTIDFFISADKGILVSLPEPTSIENTYRFIKTAYYRRLKMIEGFLDIEPLINQAMNAKMNTPNTSPQEMLKKVIDSNPDLGLRLKQEIAQFHPCLILNQVRSQADIDIGFSIQSVCRRYFGIEMDYLGYLEHDASVWQSVKKRKPLLMEFPNSKLVHHFDQIVHRLLERKI
jgi:flagellar biosynthesis protein FlhG